ncbi:hypothetical protein C5O22_07240 [Treponema sp. J25]|nr:hypothetical protein C5O22_07240 [Treponema sp. J25]
MPAISSRKQAPPIQQDLDRRRVKRFRKDRGNSPERNLFCRKEGFLKGPTEGSWIGVWVGEADVSRGYVKAPSMWRGLFF